MYFFSSYFFEDLRSIWGPLRTCHVCLRRPVRNCHLVWILKEWWKMMMRFSVGHVGRFSVGHVGWFSVGRVGGIYFGFIVDSFCVCHVFTVTSLPFPVPFILHSFDRCICQIMSKVLNFSQTMGRGSSNMSKKPRFASSAMFRYRRMANSSNHEKLTDLLKCLQLWFAVAHFLNHHVGGGAQRCEVSANSAVGIVPNNSHLIAKLGGNCTHHFPQVYRLFNDF